MRNSRRPRVLAIGGQQFFWRTHHRHVNGCEEILRLRQRGSVAGLTLIFRPGEERYIPDGGVSAAGVVRTPGGQLNLNEPGVVRALVEAADRRGWLTEVRTVGRRDGWELFDEACAETAAARVGRPEPSM